MAAQGTGHMPVIILAGGRGTRLPDSARDVPKPLVAVHGKPILAHQLDRLAAAGFRDVRLSLGFRADQIAKYVRDAGYRCRMVTEDEPLGTGGGTRAAADDLREPFIVLNGDVIADFDFRAIARSHARGTALLVSHWRDDARDFGLVELDGRMVRGFIEKPAEPVGGHISAGCYVLEPGHVALLPSGHAMLERDLFPELARRGALAVYQHSGFWEDVGTESRLAAVRSLRALPL